MSLLLDAFCQTDGRRGAYEAAEMTAYALRADNSGLAVQLKSLKYSARICAAAWHKLCSIVAQFRQLSCTTSAALLHKLGSIAAQMWQHYGAS